MIPHAVRYELLALTRNRRRIVFTVAFPLVLLVVLTSTAGDQATTAGGTHVALSRFFLPGTIAMSLVSGCFAGMVMVIVGRRESGITRRRLLTPATQRALTAAVIAATAALSLAAAAVLLTVAKLALGVGVSLPGLVAIAVTVAVGSCALCGVAFLVARRVPTTDGAQPVVQLVMFPILFVSGIWFPADDLPAGLRAVTGALPVKPLADALHRAAEAHTFSGAFDPRHLAVLAAWGLGAGALAARPQRGSAQGPLATRRVRAASAGNTGGWAREVSAQPTVPASERTT